MHTCILFFFLHRYWRVLFLQRKCLCLCQIYCMPDSNKNTPVNFYLKRKRIFSCFHYLFLNIFRPSFWLDRTNSISRSRQTKGTGVRTVMLQQLIAEKKRLTEMVNIMPAFDGVKTMWKKQLKVQQLHDTYHYLHHTWKSLGAYFYLHVQSLGQIEQKIKRAERARRKKKDKNMDGSNAHE